MRRDPVRCYATGISVCNGTALSKLHITSTLFDAQTRPRGGMPDRFSRQVDRQTCPAGFIRRQGRRHRLTSIPTGVFRRSILTNGGSHVMDIGDVRAEANNTRTMEVFFSLYGLTASGSASNNHSNSLIDNDVRTIYTGSG